jgi:hypothetical protein
MDIGGTSPLRCHKNQITKRGGRIKTSRMDNGEWSERERVEGEGGGGKTRG